MNAMQEVMRNATVKSQGSAEFIELNKLCNKLLR